MTHTQQAVGRAVRSQMPTLIVAILLVIAYLAGVLVRNHDAYDCGYTQSIEHR